VSAAVGEAARLAAPLQAKTHAIRPDDPMDGERYRPPAVAVVAVAEVEAEVVLELAAAKIGQNTNRSDDSSGYQKCTYHANGSTKG
jgi:hypothetical protein